MTLKEKSMTFARMKDHFARAKKIDFDPDNAKFIIVSDSHKWDRGETDFFKAVEPIYLQALDYYNSNGFTLVLLGDIEEGAADLFQHVLSKYQDTFAKERQFSPDRYFRVYGNHDHDWKKDDVRRKLDAIMGRPIPAYPSLLLGDQIFIVHGHEGDLFSDELHEFSQIALRLFKRLFERLSGKKPSTAENSERRSRRAQLLYEWGKINKKIIIAGHTHLAYFASVSITRIMSNRIKVFEAARRTQIAPGMAAVQDHFIDATRRIRETQDQFFGLEENLPDESLPLYFNSGCCKYSNGMTGIEISEGRISLVRWAPAREILNGKRLDKIRSQII